MPAFRVIQVPVRGGRLKVKPGIYGATSSNCAALKSVDDLRGALQAGAAVEDAFIWKMLIDQTMISARKTYTVQAHQPD